MTVTAGVEGRDAAALMAEASRRDGAVDPPRLTHEPALDGLRGVAVATVVVFHLGRMTGGFLGVDLFFVLSGFLITSLLLTEHRGSGAISLGRFWSRRARRLLPALVVVLLAIAVLIGWLTTAGDRPGFRGDALATLGYVANWHALADDAGYWDMFADPSPLDHMWSLAIEEQFYVVWPLAVVGLLALARRRSWAGPTVVAVAAGGAAAGSFLVMAATYSPLDTSRAYYGTDARIGPTLLGAALAAVAVGRDRRGATRPVARRHAGATGATVGALAAAGVMAWAFVRIDGTGATYYRGGLVAFSLAAVALIHLTTGDRTGPVVGRVLCLRPLRALGLVSYGVYLWHWPVIVYLTPERAPVDGWALDVLRVAVTLAVAAVSYAVVERPIRRGALRGRTVRVSLVGAMAVTVVAVLAVTSGVARVPGTDLAMGEASAGGAQVYPETIPPGATRILLVGDSGPLYLGPALADAAEAAGAVAASSSQPHCTILEPEGTTRWRDGSIDGDGQPCHDRRRSGWADLVERYDPDVVVYYIAASGGASEVLMDGEWVEECEPSYDRYLADALRADADLLARGGATVAFATTPSGPFVLAGEAVVEALGCRRATLDAVAAARPGTAVVDMAAVVEDGDAALDESMFRDPVHLSDQGAEFVAEWLVPEAIALVE